MDEFISRDGIALRLKQLRWEFEAGVGEMPADWLCMLFDVTQVLELDDDQVRDVLGPGGWLLDEPISYVMVGA